MVICTRQLDVADNANSQQGQPSGAENDIVKELPCVSLPLPKRCALRVSLKADREAKLEGALLRSLHEAKSQFRLRLGLCQSLRILEWEPTSVLMCVLPVNDANKDSLDHVQLLLIEAYCNEHSIRMLKVHAPENLWNIVKHNNESDIEDEEGGLDEEENDFDDGIVLILNSHVDNAVDDDLLSVFDEENRRASGSPEVTLLG